MPSAVVSGASGPGESMFNEFIEKKKLLSKNDGSKITNSNEIVSYFYYFSSFDLLSVLIFFRPKIFNIRAFSFLAVWIC